MDQSFENGVYYSPGKRVLSYFVFTKLLSIIILFVILGIGVSLVPALSSLVSLIILAGVVMCVIVFVLAYIQYRSVKFMLDEVSFRVQRGIFSKSEIAIPYKQIQNVSHEQSLSEKMWGIAHITVETAGTDESESDAESEGELPVLDALFASTLEKELLDRASGKL